MPISWMPVKQTLQDKILAEQTRVENEAEKNIAQKQPWQPVTTIPQTVDTVTEPVVTDTWQPIEQETPDPTTGFTPTQQMIMDYQPTKNVVETQTIQPVTEPSVAPITTKKKATFNPEKPFSIGEPEAPLWSKAISFIGKPFELVQQYAFDPLLTAAHLPFTRKLTPDEVKLADKQGIGSYMPGGVRRKAYDDLEYFGKWAVEMLPWLIVPPVGAVGSATGAGARGVAGALGKLGTGGRVAGKALEYSPAGLAEKAIGGVVGSLTGRKAPTVIKPTGNPVNDEVLKAIHSAQREIPEQKFMNKELRADQATKVMEAANSGLGVDAIYKAAGGAGEKVQFAGIRSSVAPETIKHLEGLMQEKAKTQPFTFMPAKPAFSVLMDGGDLPNNSQLKALAKILGDDIVNGMVRRVEDTRFNQILDVLNASRSVLASGDLSWPLRQGVILMTRYPQYAPKVFGRMLKATYSDKNLETLDKVVRSRPYTAIADDLVGPKGTRLDLTAIPSRYSTSPISVREESYASKFIQNIPILGSVVKASNRAFVGAANDMRSLAWENTISGWKKAGLNATENDYSQLARLINTASGRGDYSGVFAPLARSSNLLNATIFSPRLLLARMQWPTMIFSNSQPVRKEAMKQMVAFLGAGSSLLGLAAMAGAKIELDPRSADFGKMKVGNTRLDIWGGYVQYMRFLTQVSTGQRKTSGGNVTDVNRWETLNRMAQSKASPLASLFIDLFKGESYAGEEVNLDTQNLQRQVYNRLTPLFIQDLLDAIDQEGLAGGMVAAPAILGVGTVTYLSAPDKMRNQLAQEQYGKQWKELDNATQLDIERSNPKLLALVQQEQEDYNKTITGKADLNNVYRNETLTIEDYYKEQVDRASQEFRDTGDGYTFKEKLNTIASNRRSQYEVLNANPMFAKITAKYDELPNPNELNRMTPQDWARKWYMSMLYGKDMYDQYGNYRFDAADDMKQLFIEKFGQSMLDYIETYQGIKDSQMSPEYQEFKQAQKVLRPYWDITSNVIKMFGQKYADSPRGQAFISKQKKAMRARNKEVDKYVTMFYVQPK